MEDLETILELKEEHVESMGIPLGHKLKIIKKIKDLRQEKGLSTGSQSRLGTDRKPAAEPEQKTEAAAGTPAKQQSSLKNGQYDEGESHNQFLEALNAWRKAEPAEDQDPKSSNKKVRWNDTKVEREIKSMEESKQARSKAAKS